MKLISVAILFAGLVGLAFSYDASQYQKALVELYNDETYVSAYQKRVDELLAQEPDYFRFTPFKSPYYQFNCDVSQMTSEQKPTSVHALRPGDVQVVGAMGDSITAACGAGASTLLGLGLEYRGQSWSIGGQSDLKEVVTLPNILRQFNPRLKGFNTKSDTTIILANGAGFNTAISGSVANGMPGQAKRLVDRMKNSRDISFQNDWKVVTLFVSGNDLCNFCRLPDLELFTPENYVGKIEEALDYLHAHMPRTFVNLVQAVNITDIKDMDKGICAPLHRLICKCGAYPPSDQAAQKLDDYIRKYHSGTRKLIDSGKYDTRDDFTVVIQPFFEDFLPPRTPDNSIDYSYLAPDCFHFSSKGHALVATGLWNNMLEPVGQKTTDVAKDAKIACPTAERPYLGTAKNSA